MRHLLRSGISVNGSPRDNGAENSGAVYIRRTEWQPEPPCPYSAGEAVLGAWSLESRRPPGLSIGDGGGRGRPAGGMGMPLHGEGMTAGGPSEVNTMNVRFLKFFS